MKARLLWLLGIACLLLPVFDDPPLESGAYLQSVVGHGAVVAMITEAPTDLTLELRGEEGVRRLTSKERRRHVFELEGLRPDRRYEYAVLDTAGEELESGSFRSAPDRDDAEVHFAVVGDSGKRPFWRGFSRSPLLYLPARWNWLPVAGDLQRTAEHITENAPDFWLHTGDVVYYEGEYRYYETGFFQPFAELLRHSPPYPVVGNHDLMNDGGRQLMRNFILPGNPLTGDERLFSFAYGAVRVIGLELEGVVDETHLALQYLREQLREASEPWVLVMSHHPYYSASDQGDRADLQEHMLPLLKQYQVDLYLAGHDHNYQRFSGEDDGVIQVISGGGGKSLYLLHDHPKLVKSVREFHFCSVVVSGAVLTLQAIGNDSGLFDELVLDKREESARLEALREINPERYARIRALFD